MSAHKIRPFYCIYNDCDFPDKSSEYSPCLIACNIPTKEEAETILKTNILSRFPEHDPDGFFIYEDYDTVAWRLENGETLEEIFRNDNCGIFY